jgi:hypothetical protein
MVLQGFARLVDKTLFIGQRNGCRTLWWTAVSDCGYSVYINSIIRQINNTFGLRRLSFNRCMPRPLASPRDPTPGRLRNPLLDLLAFRFKNNTFDPLLPQVTFLPQQSHERSFPE